MPYPSKALYRHISRVKKPCSNAKSQITLISNYINQRRNAKRRKSDVRVCVCVVLARSVEQLRQKQKSQNKNTTYNENENNAKKENQLAQQQ